MDGLASRMTRFQLLIRPTLVWAWRVVVCVLAVFAVVDGNLLALAMTLISAAGALTVEARP